MDEHLTEEYIKENCPFCDLKSSALKFLLKKTLNFIVVHDANPLTEGHLLIIPREHLSCVGEYPPALFKEFVEIYSKCIQFLHLSYGEVSSFEHGVIGQTVFHSHVHLLPFNKGNANDIIPEGEKYLKKISDIKELTSVYEKKKQYLFFSVQGEYFLVDEILSTPRFFRNRFAKALGVPERADWKQTQMNPVLRAPMLEDIQKFQKKWGNFSF